jgi:mRNA interferase MazF
MYIKKGDIFYALLKGDGSVLNGKRPVIISSNNANNTYAPTVQVIPLTSRDKKRLPVHVDVPKSCGVDRDSIALIEQEQTIDKRDLLGSQIGSCPMDVLKQIDKAIMIQKGMAEPIDLHYIRYLAKSVLMYGNLIKKLHIPTDEVLYYTSSLQELKMRCGEYGIDYKIILEKTLQSERDEMQCSLRKIVGVI